MCVFVSVCVRERARERESVHKERLTAHQYGLYSYCSFDSSSYRHLLRVHVCMQGYLTCACAYKVLVCLHVYVRRV